VLTLHRPSNVDEPATLRPLVRALREVADRVPLIFPVHPRTRARIDALELGGLLDTPRVLLLPRSATWSCSA